MQKEGGGGEETATSSMAWTTFDPYLYRQPALDTAPLKPDPPAAEAKHRNRLKKKKAIRRKERKVGSGSESDDDDDDDDDGENLVPEGEGNGGGGGGVRGGIEGSNRASGARLGSGPGVMMSGAAARSPISSADTTSPLLAHQQESPDGVVPTYRSTQIESSA
jgi:hypothetical protein